MQEADPVDWPRHGRARSEQRRPDPDFRDAECSQRDPHPSRARVRPPDHHRIHPARIRLPERPRRVPVLGRQARRARSGRLLPSRLLHRLHARLPVCPVGDRARREGPAVARPDQDPGDARRPRRRGPHLVHGPGARRGPARGAHRRRPVPLHPRHLVRQRRLGPGRFGRPRLRPARRPLVVARSPGAGGRVHGDRRDRQDPARGHPRPDHGRGPPAALSVGCRGVAGPVARRPATVDVPGRGHRYGRHPGGAVQPFDTRSHQPGLQDRGWLSVPHGQRLQPVGARHARRRGAGPERPVAVRLDHGEDGRRDLPARLRDAHRSVVGDVRRGRPARHRRHDHRAAGGAAAGSPDDPRRAGGAGDRLLRHPDQGPRALHVPVLRRGRGPRGGLVALARRVPPAGGGGVRQHVCRPDDALSQQPPDRRLAGRRPGPPELHGRGDDRGRPHGGARLGTAPVATSRRRGAGGRDRRRRRPGTGSRPDPAPCPGALGRAAPPRRGRGLDARAGRRRALPGRARRRGAAGRRLRHAPLIHGRSSAARSGAGASRHRGRRARSGGGRRRARTAAGPALAGPPRPAPAPPLAGPAAGRPLAPSRPRGGRPPRSPRSLAARLARDRVAVPADVAARRAGLDALRRGLSRPHGHRVPPGLAVRPVALGLRMDPPAPRQVRDGPRHRGLGRRPGERPERPRRAGPRRGDRAPLGRRAAARQARRRPALRGDPGVAPRRVRSRRRRTGSASTTWPAASSSPRSRSRA